jgi:hypothetical protein
MPLATKNNAIILKDGKLAENCDCCGGEWYCDGGVCGSCISGSYPSAINTSIRLTFSGDIEGIATLPAKLKLFATVDQGIGACADYRFSVGPGANPRSVGYSPESPLITYTKRNVSPPVQITTTLALGMSVTFGGSCFRAFGGSLTPSQIALGVSDLRNANFGISFQFDIAPIVAPAFISSSSPLCYADWPGIPSAPIYYDNGISRFSGTFSLSVLSVE